MSDQPSPPPPRPRRSQPREVVELRQLGQDRPELAEAVDLQIALFELCHRVQSRLTHHDLDLSDQVEQAELAAGRPLLAFAKLTIDWTEVRLMVRRTAELLQRFEALEPGDAQAIVELSREGHTLEPLVVDWYESTRKLRGTGSDIAAEDSTLQRPAIDAEALDQVLLQAMRPFLGRCAETVLARLDTAAWSQGYCPLCGGEPEMAVITRDARRRLICSRCLAQWDFNAIACPHCRNDDRTRITSFASRDRLYRIAACDVCLRYIKAYDARQSERPLLVGLDAVATLPLDAAAMQKGYRA